MPKLLTVRELTEDEQAEGRRLAHRRTAAARLVERARSVWLAAAGRGVAAIAAAAGGHEQTLRRWLTRCNAGGVTGLHDQPRPGCPATETAEQIGAVGAAALAAPRAVGQPFADWPYDRLAVYLNEAAAVAIKRRRIQEVLVAEGLRWRQQETWFGRRVDPDFAAKRG